MTKEAEAPMDIENADVQTDAEAPMDIESVDVQAEPEAPTNEHPAQDKCQTTKRQQLVQMIREVGALYTLYRVLKGLWEIFN